jgi:hypothetical protein
VKRRRPAQSQMTISTRGAAAQYVTHVKFT